MEKLQYYGLIFLAYILSGLQTVSGCVTQQFENGNMALELSCPITSFTGSGIWSVDGSQMTNCNSGGFCNTVTNGNYMFTSNSSGIYVMINPYLTTEVGKNWTCNHLLIYCSIIVEPPSESPIFQMNTSIATERTTRVNNIFEFGNISITMKTGTIVTTSDISLTTSNLNKESENLNSHFESTNFYSNALSTNFYSNTESINLYSNAKSSNFYSNTESTNLYSNAESTNVYSNTESTNLYSNAESTIFYSNTESPKFYSDTEITNVYPNIETISSYVQTETTNVNEITETAKFYANTETTNIDDSFKFDEIQTNTLTESLLLSISGNSSSFQHTNYKAESSLISTAVIDQSSYSSKIQDPSFLSHQYLSESSESSQFPSVIIDTMNIFLYTTNSLITTHLHDTSILFDDFTDSYRTFSHDYAASTSTSLDIFYNSTNNYLSLQTTEYYIETMQTEVTLLYESHTDNAATGIYSKEIVTSGKSYMLTSVMPTQTKLTSMNSIQDSITYFQSTYFEPNTQSKDEFFSSEISKYLLSTLQSTSLLLPFNTKVNVSRVESYMETTNMMTFESQTKDLTLLTNPSSIKISAVSFDFKPTLLTTAIIFDSKTMPSMIKPSSQRTNSDNSYTEIGTSSKDLSSFINSLSESVTYRELLMTSEVIELINTLSTSTIQSGLSEKNKNIIFITTTSAVVTIIVVILLVIFAKLYMSKYNLKPPKEGDNISWSNYSILPKAAFPGYSVTGKRIYPLLNTSSTSFKMHPYKHNWDDLV